MSDNDHRMICSYLDILTISDYKILYFDLKIIYEKDIPNSIRTVALNSYSDEIVLNNTEETDI